MKRSLLFSAILLFVTAFAACTKGGASDTPPQVYRGVVLFSVCSHTVIQTIGSPNYIGQDTWTADSYGTPQVYHHVFVAQNGCQLSGHLAQGDTFSFRIIKPQVQDCITCMIAVAVPDSTYPIQVF